MKLSNNIFNLLRFFWVLVLTMRGRNSLKKLTKTGIGLVLVLTMRGRNELAIIHYNAP